MNELNLLESQALFNEIDNNISNNEKYKNYIIYNFKALYNEDHNNLNGNNFNIFCKYLHKKIGIIIVFNMNIKDSLVHIYNLFKKMSMNNKTFESIQKYCLIYLLDESIISEIDNIEIILKYLNLNHDNLPLILFAKKDYIEQEFNEKCLKCFISDFKEEETFKLILENFTSSKNYISTISNNSTFSKKKSYI